MIPSAVAVPVGFFYFLVVIQRPGALIGRRPACGAGVRAGRWAAEMRIEDHPQAALVAHAPGRRATIGHVRSSHDNEPIGHDYVPSGEVAGASLGIMRTGPSIWPANVSTGRRRYRCHLIPSQVEANSISTMPEPPHQPHRWPGSARRQIGHGLEAFMRPPWSSVRRRF